MFKRQRHRKDQRGQTLILALFCFIVLLVGAFFLFDLHNVIRMKIKTKNGVDAAALTAANWQRYTLNMIGDVNLLKMSESLLLSVGAGQTGIPPEKPNSAIISAKIRDAYVNTQYLLLQLQTRARFTGPIIGFGAAQQSAKKNGLNFVPDFNETIFEYLQNVNDFEIYQPPTIPEEINGFEWRKPYLSMVASVLDPTQKGIAVAPNYQVVSEPRIQSSNPVFTYFQDKKIFTYINADYWCGLRQLLRENFSDNWWQDAHLGHVTSQFEQGSEFFPLFLSTGHGSAYRYNDQGQKAAYSGNIVQMWDAAKKSLTAYEAERKIGILNPYDQDLANPPSLSDEDNLFSPFNYMTLTFFGSKWTIYNEEYKDQWSDFLRSPLRDETSYYGANAHVWTTFVPEFRSRQGDIEPLIASATAKPLGFLESGSNRLPPMSAGGIVLPCFEQSVIIPLSLEPSPTYDMFDRAFYYFITEYLPILAGLNDLSEMNESLFSDPTHWQMLSRYHAAMLKLSDPQWRQRGLDWLDEPVKDKNGKVIGTNEDIFCNEPEGNQPGTTIQGPARLTQLSPKNKTSKFLLATPPTSSTP